MNNNKYKVFQSKDNEKTIYCTYYEKKVYVSTTCYICGATIIFGVAYILFHVTQWLLCGVNINNFWDILHLLLCLLWAWIVKENIFTLLHNAIVVQVLYKTETVFNNGQSNTIYF